MKNNLNIINKYIRNEELTVSHRLMNIILLAGFLVLPVCLIFDLLNDAAGSTWIPLVCLMVLFVTSFFIANHMNKANAAGIILTAFSTNTLVPFLFFKAGGKASGMPLWLALSSVFVWLLVRGWAVIVIYLSNVLTYAVIFYYEYTNPGSVTKLADEKAEFWDIVCSIYFTVLMYGIIYKFQSRLYEKKKDQLEEKEAQLRDINEKLERASEAKSVFFASMSHEIRTPINAIIGMNEMILRESGDDEITGYAANIENASGTLLSLVNDILDFSRIEAGVLEIVPDEYSVANVLNDSRTLLGKRAADKGLSLEIKNDPSIPCALLGDERRIRQIVINILTNAVKYTDNGGVTVSASFEPVENSASPGDGEYIRLIIEIADTGRGIPESALPTLFDSFNRVDEKKNKNIEGTGLGLAITKHLTELMDGKVEVESEVGKGSTFRVIIPQKILNREPMGDIGGNTAPQKRESKKYVASFKAPDARVLLTDDVEINARLVSLLLKTTELQTDIASSGKECLGLYELNDYDLILLDHMMPEMDGIETLDALKKTAKYQEKKTPVIALTANAIQGSDKFYLDAGFDDYLTKPVKGADLEAMILKHLPASLIRKTE